MKGAPSPFDFPGDERGVLCIHGFTGTPFEMRYLGERLNERGFTAVGPTLPGHTTTVGGGPSMPWSTTWRDWFAAVDDALSALRRRCARVYVAGLSLGGLLTLHLARTRPGDIEAIAALATPLWLGPLAQGAGELYARVPALGDAVPVIPKPGGGSDLRDPAMRARNPGFTRVPMRGLAELTALAAVVRGELREIRTPTLIMHGRRDHTAPHACSYYLAARLGAARVQRRTLYASQHVITLDVERDVVAQTVARFFD